MFDIVHHLIYSGWSQVWSGKVESLVLHGMLAQLCGAMGAGDRKATVEHDMGGMGCFVRDSVGSKC